MTLTNRVRPRRRAAIALGLAGILAATLAGCQTEVPGGDSDDPIKVGAIYDASGGLSALGAPMADAAALAIEDINDSGGVLGRPLELVNYDSQSDNAKYSEYANKLIQQDGVSVVAAGITSASREAIRPILAASGLPYFYGTLYEGGVCDGAVYSTGPVPSQQLDLLITYALENFGDTFTILAADYNFGHDEAAWAVKYIEDNGGTVVNTEFLPLDQSDFGSSINNLQRDKPSVVVSMLVGGDQAAFYKQFTSAGLKGSIGIVSPVFGNGQEPLTVGAEATDGIVVAFAYLEDIESPANEEFLARWRAKFGEDYPNVTPGAVSVWNDLHLWAAGVEKAGSLDNSKVREALESGISFDGPGGTVTIDGPTHHLIQDIHLAIGTPEGAFEVIETTEAAEPVFEQEKCDLIADPNQSTQFRL